MGSTRPERRRSTLSEVAARAGVSTTTASLVLTGKSDQHRISDDTLARVRRAAEELDYAPNLLVRSIQRGRTHVLSFYNSFRHREVNDLYMDRLSTAIETAAGARGYDVLVHCDFRRSPEETYRFLNGGRADGLLLFAPRPEDPLLPLLRASRLPVVLLNAHDRGGPLPSVKDDVRCGMELIAGNLLALGHRRFAAVVEDRGSPDAAERVALLSSSLQFRGIELPTRNVLTMTGRATALLEEILRLPDSPTAVFCWRDRLAYFLLEACEELGVPVPDRLSVVGYDGIPWPAATRHTAASVRVDLATLAQVAVERLDQRIHGGEKEGIQTDVPVQFTAGTTLGPAAHP